MVCWVPLANRNVQWICLMTAVVVVMVNFSNLVQFTDAQWLPTCNMVEEAALGIIESIGSSCSDARSQCSPGNNCIGCINGGDSIQATCKDGCAYNYGGLTVEFDVTYGYGTCYTQYGYLSFIAKGLHFTAVKGETADFFFQFMQGDKCLQATFNGYTCSCLYVYCDASHTTTGYAIDCSGTPGGTSWNTCPIPVNFGGAEPPLMWRLINAVCNENIRNHVTSPTSGSSPVVSPPSISPPITNPVPNPTIPSPPTDTPPITIGSPVVFPPSISPPITNPVPNPIAPSPPTGGTSPTPCFSGNNVVEVKDVGYIPMSQLRIGDYVKVGYDDNDYSQVYSFGHYNHDIESEFLQIYVVDDDQPQQQQKERVQQQQQQLQPLEISSQHLLFVRPEGSGMNKVIPASDIAVGDLLHGNKMVTSIHKVIRRGVYSPLTYTGDIVVSGIRASNYVNVLANSRLLLWNQHDLGHAYQYPRRLFCQYYMDSCRHETYDTNGYPIGSIIILQFASIMNDIGFMGTIIASSSSILLYGLVFMLEAISSFSLMAFFVGAVILFYVTINRSWRL